jgi:hypothetical protein
MLDSKGKHTPRITLNTVNIRASKSNTLAAALVAAAVCSFASHASAQFPAPITASDGTATFTINPYSGGVIGNGPTSQLSGTGFGGLNFLNQAWWWIRVNGEDIREFAIAQAAPIITQPTDNSIRIEYISGLGRGWRISMDFEVSYLGLNAARLVQRLTISNSTTVDVPSLSVFNFNNVTLNGTPTNELATQTGPNEIDFVDGGNSLYHGIYRPSNPDLIAVGSSLRNLLTNTGIDDIPPGVIESGPGNLEVASQWNTDLPSGSTRTFEVTYLAIPTPGAAGLLALGGLMAARRRR